MTDESRPPGQPRPSVLSLAAGVGALWGALGYALLWGHTPIVLTRRFVVSAIGTALLLPVRLVLWSIRLVEDHVVGRPFDFSRNNGWIGLLAAVVGTILAASAYLIVRWTRRWLRSRRGRFSGTRSGTNRGSASSSTR
jgi:hypothetical protein